uniref:GntR family transcriptional regulator n=1 Tax=Ndongobacter massiliensis TaxID=1871025 RepID=UPI00092FDD69|nr:GntR family transcriptional regulator [Ndongobacter massiliensis]
MNHHPIKTIRNQVYQILKDEICAGCYKPGQWLQENELADRLSVSRSPIREALRQLASDGLVVEIPNKGVFVKEFTSRDIEEVYDLRVLLEDYAIGKLHDNLTTANMEQLLKCLNELETLYAQNDLRAYTYVDSILHSLLIEMSGNSLLQSMYSRIHSIMQQFRIYSLISKKRFDESIVEHRDIIHFLLTNNTAEAQAVNKRHLLLAREKIIEHFSELGEQSPLIVLPDAKNNEISQTNPQEKSNQ